MSYTQKSLSIQILPHLRLNSNSALRLQISPLRPRNQNTKLGERITYLSERFQWKTDEICPGSPLIFPKCTCKIMGSFEKFSTINVTNPTSGPQQKLIWFLQRRASAVRLAQDGTSKILQNCSFQNTNMNLDVPNQILHNKFDVDISIHPKSLMKTHMDSLTS